jgi:hypothetical protein
MIVFCENYVRYARRYRLLLIQPSRFSPKCIQCDGSVETNEYKAGSVLFNLGAENRLDLHVDEMFWVITQMGIVDFEMSETHVSKPTAASQ